MDVELWAWSEYVWLGGSSSPGIFESAFRPEISQHLSLDMVPVKEVRWPSNLERLKVSGFDAPVAGVVWPASVLQLSFKGNFNQPLVGAAWPASVLKLSLDGNFNQPITGIVWPAFLQQLSLGYCFNQPIAEVEWPASLQEMSFGSCFNQPIVGVLWPAALQKLIFHRRSCVAGLLAALGFRRVLRPTH